MGEDGEPWWVARELAEYLGYKNVGYALKSVDPENKQKVVIEAFKSRGRGGDNSVRIIENDGDTKSP